MVDMRSTLLRPQATEEARSTHWSLACAPSVRRPSNPGPPIEAQELRRHPNHRWPATTPSRNRACLGLWIGRSNAESVERHSTAKYAEAVHQYDNGEQSRHQRDPPTTCGLSVEIGETLGANCRCQRLCTLPTSWPAFAQIHPHRTRPPAQWTSEHAAVAQENHVLSRYHLDYAHNRPSERWPRSADATRVLSKSV